MDIHVHVAIGGGNSCCAAVSHGSLEHINARRVNALTPGATETDLVPSRYSWALSALPVCHKKREDA